MIISHKHKFIFIKTRKTAGSSIEKFLMSRLGPSDIFGGMEYEDLSPKNLNTFREHADHKHIRKNYPFEWKNYYKFCVERNPWDKAVSFYYWYKESKPNKTKKGFSNFIMSRKFENRNDWWQYAGEIPFVDHVCMYENLELDFLWICSHLGIPYYNELKKIKLKSSFRQKCDYHQMYTNETKDRIATLFYKPIEYFNYVF